MTAALAINGLSKLVEILTKLKVSFSQIICFKALYEMSNDENLSFKQSVPGAAYC